MTIPPGGFALSDPLVVAVPAYAELTVSAYLPDVSRPAVRLGPVRIAAGDVAPADDAPLLRGQGVVSAVLAERPTASRPSSSPSGIPSPRADRPPSAPT